MDLNTQKGVMLKKKESIINKMCVMVILVYYVYIDHLNNFILL